MANPDAIMNTLEHFGFANVEKYGGEIRCGHDIHRNKTSIRIRLNDNPHIYVNDFSGAASSEFFSFIIKAKKVEFRTVIRHVKNELGVGDSFLPEKIEVFDGVFRRLRRQTNPFVPQRTLDPSVLDAYPQIFSKRFLDDNIPLSAQTEFDIRYDTESQRIIIPIYDSSGELVGAKGRANWEVEDDEPKYLYLIPCRCSETLYGYSHNYPYIVGESVVYVCESEKSVMQAWGYGFQNFVGLGGSRVSSQQCKLLVELMPKQIVLLPDVGLDMDITDGNVKRLQSFARLLDIKVGYWNYKQSTAPDKASPTDLGRDRLMDIIQNEIKWG